MIETPVQLLDRKREVFVKSLRDGIGISEAAREYFNIYKSVNTQGLFYTVPDGEWNLVRIAKDAAQDEFYSQQGLMNTPSGSDYGEGLMNTPSGPDSGGVQQAQPVFMQGAGSVGEGELVGEKAPYNDMQIPIYSDSAHDSIQPHEAGRTFKGSKYMSEEDYNPMRELVEHPTYGKIPAFIQTLLDYYGISHDDEHHAGKSRAEYNLERSKLHYQHNKNDQMYQDYNFLGEPDFENHNYKQYENHYHNWLKEIEQKYDISDNSPEQLRWWHLKDMVDQWTSEEVEEDEDGTKHQVGLGPFDYFKGFEWMTPRQRTAAYAHINEHGTDREDKQKFPDSGMDAHRVKQNWMMRYSPFHDYQVRPEQYVTDNLENRAEDIPKLTRLQPDEVFKIMNDRSVGKGKLISKLPNVYMGELVSGRENSPIQALAEHMFLQANPDYIQDLNEIIEQKNTMPLRDFMNAIKRQQAKFDTFDIPKYDTVNDKQGDPAMKLPDKPHSEDNLTREGFLHAIGYNSTTGNYEDSPFSEKVTRDIVKTLNERQKLSYGHRRTRNIGKVFSSRFINPDHEQFDFTEKDGKRDRRGFAEPFAKMFQLKPGLRLHPNQCYDILHANSVIGESEYGTHSLIGDRLLDEQGRDNIVNRDNIEGMLAHRGQRNLEMRIDKRKFATELINHNKATNDWLDGGREGPAPEFTRLNPKRVLAGSLLHLKKPSRSDFSGGGSGQKAYEKANADYMDRMERFSKKLEREKLSSSDVHSSWNTNAQLSVSGGKTGVSVHTHSTSGEHLNETVGAHQENMREGREGKSRGSSHNSIKGITPGHLPLSSSLNRRVKMEGEAEGVDVHMRSQHANYANAHMIASMGGAGAPPGNPVDVQDFISTVSQHNGELPLTAPYSLLVSHLTNKGGDNSLDFDNIDSQLREDKVKMMRLLDEERELTTTIDNYKLPSVENREEYGLAVKSLKELIDREGNLKEELSELRGESNKRIQKKRDGISRQRGIGLTAPILDIINDDESTDWWRNNDIGFIERRYEDSSKGRNYIASKRAHDNQIQKINADMGAISEIGGHLMQQMGLPEDLFAEDAEMQLGNFHNLLAFAEKYGFGLKGHEGFSTLNTSKGVIDSSTYNGGQVQAKLKTIVDDNGNSDIGSMEIARKIGVGIGPDDFSSTTSSQLSYKLKQLMKENGIESGEEKKAFQYRFMSVKDAMSALAKDLPEDELHNITDLLHHGREEGEQFANKLGLHYVDSNPPYLMSTPHIKSEVHDKVSLPRKQFFKLPIGDVDKPHGRGTYAYFNVKDKNIRKWPLKTNLKFSMQNGQPTYQFITPEERKFVSAPKVCYDTLLPNFNTKLNWGDYMSNKMSGVQKAPLLLASLTDPDIFIRKGDVKTPILQPMHRIFELDDLENLRGFSGDWIVTALPKGQRMFVEKKDDEVKVKGDGELEGDAKENFKKITKKDFLIDVVYTGEEYHIIDVLAYGGKDDVYTMSLQDRMKILRGTTESVENVIVPAAHNLRLTDDVGLPKTVESLNEDFDRLLLRDAESTYMKGETRHPKWVTLEPGQDVNLIVLERKGRGIFTYRLGTGPVTHDDIGDRAVEHDGETYMDVGTAFHSEDKYDIGDVVRVNAGHVSEKEIDGGHKIYTVQGNKIEGDAEGEGLSSNETLSMLAKSESTMVPHNVYRSGERVVIKMDGGKVSYRSSCLDDIWYLHNPRAENSWLIRLSETQRDYWAPVAGTMLKADLNVEEEQKAEVHESKGEGEPLIPPKKVKGTDFWEPEKVRRLLAKSLGLVESLLKSSAGAVGDASSGAQGLGIDYATPIQSPTGPTNIDDAKTMPDYDTRKKVGEDDFEEPSDEEKEGTGPHIEVTEEGTLVVDKENARFLPN